MKSSKYGIALILLVPIGLVAGPVLRAGLRSEVAHWYLAAAANAIELGNGKAETGIKADNAIESARTWDPEIGKLPDYLSVRLRQFQSKGTDLSLSDIFREVPQASKLQIAEQLAKQYFDRGDFALAVDVMQVLLGEEANQRTIYWKTMVYRDLMEVSEAKAVQTLRDAIATYPDKAKLRTLLASELAYLLEIREDFTSTLEAYKIYIGEKYDRTVYNLNALAYHRALANVELDQALIDIDEALGYQPDASDLRDTRAWIYFQLGRYEEAFVDADLSVKTYETPSMWRWLESALDWLQGLADRAESKSQVNTTVAAPSANLATGQGDELGARESDPPIVMLDPPKNYLTRSKAKASIWASGVLRYHRAMILEKLGRTAEAEADWQWIEENQLPPDDRLH